MLKDKFYNLTNFDTNSQKITLYYKSKYNKYKII